ncbi:hypothetical protein ABPG74_004538 [Tetrahymena malaccensis]
MIDDSPQLKPSSNQQLKDTLETELQQIQQCQTQLVKQDTIFGQIDSNKQPQLQQQQQNILNQMTTRINNVPQLLEPDSIVESQSQNTIQSKLQGENDAKQETQQKQLFTSKFSLTKKTEKNQNDQSQLDQRLKIQSIVPNNKNSIQISKTNETNNTSKEITTRQRVLNSIVEQMVQDSQQQQNTLNLVSLPTTHDIIPQLLKPSFTVDQKQQNLIKSQFSVANQLQENKKKNFINQLQQKLKKIVPKSSQSTEKSNKKDICNISKDIITKKRVLSITVRKSQSGQSPTLINPQQKKNQNQDAKILQKKTMLGLICEKSN